MMRRKKMFSIGILQIEAFRLHAAIAAIFLLLSSVNPVLGNTLTIPGTGSFEAALRSLAEAFNRQHPGHQIIIPSSIGSGGGIRAIIQGDEFMARVARPLKGDEAAHGLRYVVFAKDAVVFAVGKRVSVNDLSVQQLLGIFSGTITHWNQIGGRYARIRVLTREPGDSSLRIIRDHLSPFADYDPTQFGKRVYHDYEMVRMLGKYGSAIGWGTVSSLHLSAGETHTLAIDGISPTLENLRSGAYPLSADCALVYDPLRITSLGHAFLTWLASETGQEKMNELGLVPVEAK